MADQISRLEVVHRRLTLWVYLVGLLLIVLGIAGLGFSWAWVSYRVPSLATFDSPLGEALKWPWSDFPSVTRWERDRIRSELRVGGPVMVAEVLPWPSARIPTSGMFSFRGSSRSAVIEGTRAVEALLRGKGQNPIDLGTADQATRELFALAERQLTRAGNHWVPLYNRGVLYHWCGNATAATRDFASALALIQPVLDGSQTSTTTGRVRCEEAGILTHYAAGHAYLVRQGPEPARRALAELRAAARLITPHRRAYPEVPSNFSNFQLEHSRLSTRSVWNDLVAIYEALSGYHYCDQPPSRHPCAESADQPDRDDLCAYRDRIMCNSQRRAGVPYEAAFDRFFDRFYGEGQAWEDEHLLWALSNLVDLASQDKDLFFDPYLLYNSASLMVRLGEFDLAQEQILQADASASSAGMPREHSDRLSKLNVVVRVLGGEPVRARVGQRSRETSLIRQRFIEYYANEVGTEIVSFPRLGSYFPESRQESFIDCWLFIHLWREWLRSGQLDQFLAEYQRLIDEKGIPIDFFKKWRQEVMTEFGDRALARADSYSGAGEDDRARLIRRFLTDSGHFPASVKRRARTFGWWLRTLLLWGFTAMVVILVPVTILGARGILALNRRTFLGAHHRERTRKEP